MILLCFSDFIIHKNLHFMFFSLLTAFVPLHVLVARALNGNAHNKIEKRGFRLLLFASHYVRASARAKKKESFLTLENL